MGEGVSPSHPDSVLFRCSHESLIHLRGLGTDIDPIPVGEGDHVVVTLLVSGQVDT